MIIMALDHTRDLWSDAHVDPLDLLQTTPALFFTRWITHFCAPVFVFLAGTSVWLQESYGKSKRELSLFLVTRGLWLIFLELTWVHIVWAFDFQWRIQVLQVIWALGASMIVLAALIHLPLWAVVTVGVGMCLFHNLLDDRLPRTWWATILHIQAPLYSGGTHLVFIIYPLIPWVGVMAAGYAFARLLPHRRAITFLGGAMVAAFIILRSINIYGDPHRWAPQRSSLYTLLSFINCTKYPPSLDYLLMTLGPAVLLLALLHRVDANDAHPVAVFGRVPVFYYLLHIPLLSLGIAAIYYKQYNNSLVHINGPMDVPVGFGFSLPVVYLTWIAVVAILYLPCRAWARLKDQRRSWWLRYL